MSSRPLRTVSISSHEVRRFVISSQRMRFSFTGMTMSRSPLIHARCIQR